MSVEKAESRATMFCPQCRGIFAPGTTVCPHDGNQLVQEESDSADALIGSTFAERYQILAVLGKGGMGVVYKARHVNMDSLVAIKVLWPQYDEDASTKERFQLEAKAAAALHHPNIIQVFDFGSSADGRTFLIMEYLEGTSLGDFLDKNGRMEVARAVDIFVQSCDGLSHAHKKGVLHRDLKPSNLVIVNNESGQDLVKVVDFGIAKFMHRDSKKEQNLTKAGEIFGSPLYMSPEQCQAKPLDARSDIYSLGCVMYEVLTGMPPLMGQNSFETMVKHVQEQPLSLRGIAPELDIPELVDTVVLKALRKEPDKRQQTMDELKEQLLEAAKLSLVHLSSSAANLYEPKTFTGNDTSALHPVPVPTLAPPSSNWQGNEAEKTEGEMQSMVLQAIDISRKAQHTNLALRFILASVVGLLILVLLMFFLPGSSLDPWNGWDRIVYNFYLRQADGSAKEGEYNQQAACLNKAAAFAAKQKGGFSRELGALLALLQVYEGPLKGKIDHAQINALKGRIIKANLEQMETQYGDEGPDLSDILDLDNELISPDGRVDPSDLDAETAEWYGRRLVQTAKLCFQDHRYKKAISWLREALQLEDRAHGFNAAGKKEVTNCAQEFSNSLSTENSDGKEHVDEIKQLLAQAQEAEKKDMSQRER